MAQHDYIIANQSAAAFRADLNNALAAIVSNNSGPNEPNPTYAYQPWADTTTGLLKQRNAANNGWVVLGTLAEAYLGLLSRSGGTMTGALITAAGTAAAPAVGVGETSSGVFRKGSGQLGVATAGAERGFFDSKGWNGPVNATSLNGGQLAGMRNRIINGAMAVDQRNAGAAQTITAGAALAYTVDRWYAYCAGANVTGQRVQDASTGLFRYRFTGAAGVTSIGFGQRIEQANSADLAGQVVRISLDLANSLGMPVSWTAFYANTADSFGTLASPTRVLFATGTITGITSTVSRYSLEFGVSGAATTGVEIVFSVGALTSGTWTIGNVQVEPCGENPGTVATPFERRSFGQELALCKRYWQSGSFQTGGTTTSGVGFYGQIFYEVEFRATPTLVFSSVGAVGNFDTAVPAVASVSNAKQVSFLKTATATGSGIYSFNWAGAAEL